MKSLHPFPLMAFPSKTDGEFLFHNNHWDCDIKKAVKAVKAIKGINRKVPPPGSRYISLAQLRAATAQ